MKKKQFEILAMELGNVGMALSEIEVKGEKNLNLLLASIQTIRKVKEALEGVESNDDHDEQRADV